MTTVTLRSSAPEVRADGRVREVVAPALRDRLGDVAENLGPNWFAAVMGTGIIANAAATLPWQFPGLRAVATVVWALASILLVLVAAAFALHWLRYPERARAHGRHPVMSQFYGAPPMALLTVGAGTMLLGGDVIGPRAALATDWVLWPAGTVLGLLAAVGVPYRMITRHRFDPDAAFGGWLMPVVPPMVSAATGALLIPHLPAGQPRLTMLLACYAMFGLSLIAALITTTLIWSRLLHYGAPGRDSVATVWLVLGPLGQSVTAAGLLANVAPGALPDLYAKGFGVFAVVYGVVAWGFAMLWLALAVAVTAQARKTMPFNLTWWGFTFPVGTCVTGSATLFAHSGADIFAVAAVGLYVLLVAAWGVVGVRTVSGVVRGSLFRVVAG